MADTLHADEMHTDDWSNFLTGVGTPERDNRTAWVSYANRRQQALLEETWRGGGLAARVVELPANDMTREAGDVRLGEDALQEQQALLNAAQDEMQLWLKIRLAVCYARAYGGGALVMAVDDGMPWSEPVNERQIRSVRALHPATPDEIQACRWYSNKWHPKYTFPSRYRWNPRSIPGGGVGGVTNEVIHETRVLQFMGAETSTQQRVENQGWGDSILGRVEQRISDTMSAVVGAAVLVQDFGQAVLSIEGLQGLLKDAQGNAMLKKRLDYMRMARSSLGFMLIGKEETFRREPTPISGLAELINTFYLTVATDTGIPMPILTGQSQAGLGDNVSPMSKVWQAEIRAQQRNVIKPQWDKLTRYQLLARDGPMRGAPEPKKWVVGFRSLEFMTAKEKADLANVVSQTDNANILNGLYTAEDAAKSHFSGPEFNPEVTVDFKAQAPLAPVVPEAQLPGASEVPAPATQPEAPPAPASGEPASATALNGAQVQSAQGIVKDVATRQIPRASGVGMLMKFFNLSQADAEQIMGEVGRTFFVAPEGQQGAAPAASAPIVARSDDVEEYTALLAAEVNSGELSAEEVARKLARLYSTSLSSARGMLRSRLEELRRPRADVAPAVPPAGNGGGPPPSAPPTHFPRRGDNKPVALISSEYAVFDPQYAAQLRDDWPELWGRASMWDRQYERLLPLARGGAVQTQGEEMAVRIREAWARTYGGGRSLSNVLAQVKHLVVGKLGEAGMKLLLEQEKERVRRRRKGAAEP